jgi:unsaturated rhamnogalacturonyl hydrolase
MVRLLPKPLRPSGNRFPRRALPSGTWLLLFVATILSTSLAAFSQSTQWSVRIANTIISRHPADKTGAPSADAWDEETGRQLQGLAALWYDTAKGDYFRYGKSIVDLYIDSANRTTQVSDSASLGRQLLLMYRVTLAAKYYKAAAEIRQQIAADCDASSARPREPQSRGLCTAQPFLAEYASVFQEPQDFAGITRGFERWNASAHSLHKGAGPGATSADSSSLASLSAALVDSLPYYPKQDPGRPELISMLKNIAAAVEQHQDRDTGLFDEATVSTGSTHRPVSPPAACLLVYALAKGARLGYLPEHTTADAEHAWQGILRYAAKTDADRLISLRPDLLPGRTSAKTFNEQRSSQAGDGPDANVSAGLGSFLLASTEVDHAPTAGLARGQTVMVDAWYNSQQRKNAAGQMESFHYKWSDLSDSGYSLLGHIFQNYGAATETLDSAPTQSHLAQANFYIIASPDIPIKNPNPNYMSDHDAGEVAAWVKKGGVLVLMENDPPNADVSHLNLLADHFGIHFDDVLHHHIIGEQVEDGRIPVAAEGPLFHHPHTLYMKDTCAISLSGTAVALLRDRGDVVMAAAKYGRGTVFAAVDPWLYNEYTDGRKKPLIYDQFDNFAGGQELVQWLLEQRPH